MQKRRSFFRKLIGLGAAGATVPFFQSAQARTKKETNFIHHVYFWMKNPEDASDRKMLLDGLKEMGTIASITLLHIGTPADTDRDVIDNTYHYSFLVGFKDRKGHDDYQVHPIHDKFRNELGHLWEKVLVYDSVDLR